MKNMYYLDVNFYRYFIGREDQSVNEAVMIRRIDQQLKVNKLMADAFHACTFPNKRVRNYMLSYLDIITTVSSTRIQSVSSRSTYSSSAVNSSSFSFCYFSLNTAKKKDPSGWMRAGLREEGGEKII